jgi:hypothetical protein
MHCGCCPMHTLRTFGVHATQQQQQRQLLHGYVSTADDTAAVVEARCCKHALPSSSPAIKRSPCVLRCAPPPASVLTRCAASPQAGRPPATPGPAPWQSPGYTPSSGQTARHWWTQHLAGGKWQCGGSTARTGISAVRKDATGLLFENHSSATYACLSTCCSLSNP